MVRALLFLLIPMVLIEAPRPVEASQEMRDKMELLADTILKATKNQPVSIGIFSPTDLPETNSGPGIEATLIDALGRKLPGSVRPDAKFEVKGDYAFAKSRDPQQQDLTKVIKIKARIVDKEFSDDILQIPLEITFDATKTIAEVLQVTVSLPADGTKQERNAKLDKARRAPEVEIGGTLQSLVSSSDGSPYAVELLVKPANSSDIREAESRAATVIDGQAFVEIARDELYEIRLYNRSKLPVAASITVDGLDIFHFSQDRMANGRPRFSHLIISPGTTDTVVGWHHSLEGTKNFISFLVTAYGEGAASKEAGSARGKVGVIHVQFSNCKPLGEGERSAAGNETGFGPPREVKQKPVRFEIKPPHDFVSIRYSR